MDPVRRSQDRVVTACRLDCELRANRLDRPGQQRLPIGAGQPTRTAAMAPALEHRTPYRLTAAGASDPAGGERGDHGKTLEPGLPIGEGDEAGLAKRVATVTGDNVQQVVHLAVPLAE